MKTDMNPRISVLLSDLEIHWLIQRHKADAKENSPCTVGRMVNWSQMRVNELNASWDKAK